MLLFLEGGKGSGVDCKYVMSACPRKGKESRVRKVASGQGEQVLDLSQARASKQVLREIALPVCTITAHPPQDQLERGKAQARAGHVRTNGTKVPSPLVIDHLQ
ncbi:hypothetical protein ONS95_001985 [Cadophora gregata]|uniref:uncharacterized protein n=1 Tax=Cadophora gregata TaxID=51156 RepID=UPI0026DD387C|nr:uncharacterized protein ONS95_001985 [Cadophora gregata]KAK0111641.1 hypothetical protein ONS95_001985 [Cadophora gregata]KAK0111884.1 hypothetical protein ONS96_001152 [Cadophora gregata f. sp. sojae]